MPPPGMRPPPGMQGQGPPPHMQGQQMPPPGMPPQGKCRSDTLCNLRNSDIFKLRFSLNFQVHQGICNKTKQGKHVRIYEYSDFNLCKNLASFFEHYRTL
jgi:hypothetical protein